MDGRFKGLRKYEPLVPSPLVCWVEGTSQIVPRFPRRRLIHMAVMDGTDSYTPVQVGDTRNRLIRWKKSCKPRRSKVRGILEGRIFEAVPCIASHERWLCRTGQNTRSARALTCFVNSTVLETSWLIVEDLPRYDRLVTLHGQWTV